MQDLVSSYNEKLIEAHIREHLSLCYKEDYIEQEEDENFDEGNFDQGERDQMAAMSSRYYSFAKLAITAVAKSYQTFIEAMQHLQSTLQTAIQSQNVN